MTVLAVTLSQVAPQQFKPERGSRFSGKKAFQDWLESIPLANMSAAGNELLAGLQELNHTKVTARFRLQCLEDLLEPVLAVVAALDKHFSDTGFPQSEKNERIGRVAVQFFREMALGYRLTGDQQAGGSAKVSLLSSRTTALCIHRSLACLEQMMYRASLQYHSIPPQVWNEVHVLYAYAFQNSLQHKSFKDTIGWLKQQFTIDDIYKRVVVIGISDPARLSQRAIRQVYLASELWARRCQMGTGEQARASAGRFEIGVDSDEPPRLIVEDHPPEKRPDFIIDISKLRDWLDELLAESEDPLRTVQFKVEGQESLLIDAGLLRQLVATWGIRQERSYKRLPGQQDIHLISGINNIHYILSGQMPFDQFLEQSRDNQFNLTGDAINNWVASSDQALRPTLQTANVLNQSLGGYRLRLTDLEGVSLKVGELVALCASAISGRDALWMIGVIRWLSAQGTEELEIGVAVIGQSALTAALQCAETTGKAIPPFRGLLIQPFAPRGEADPSLIVPAFFARNSAEARICVRDGDDFQVNDVTLSSLIERTSEYCRYQFQFVDETESDQAEEDASPDLPDAASEMRA